MRSRRASTRSPSNVPELRPVEEYLKPQGRFRHLTPELIGEIQERVNKEYEKLQDEGFDAVGRGDGRQSKGDYPEIRKRQELHHSHSPGYPEASSTIFPREALDALCANLGVSQSLVYHLATFYRAFSLTPKGKYRLSLCLGTACHVRGAPQISDHVERTLGIKPGETSKDLEFSFETVNCLGACALGPILVVNDEYHGQMTIAKTSKVLQEHRREG